jgi:hypothetical protein
VTLRGRDSGIGIAPELLACIFDWFTQAERSLDPPKAASALVIWHGQQVGQALGGIDVIVDHKDPATMTVHAAGLGRSRRRWQGRLHQRECHSAAKQTYGFSGSLPAMGRKPTANALAKRVMTITWITWITW